MIQIISRILNIDELSNNELLELYDAIDEAYNAIIATYLERIVKDPTKRNMEELVKLAIIFAINKNRKVVEELALIAILDIFSFVAYSTLIDKFESKSYRSGSVRG
ncbi:MAG: hypothetical protein QXL96_07160 [Ignisphaera sp.]